MPFTDTNANSMLNSKAAWVFAEVNIIARGAFWEVLEMFQEDVK